MVHFKLKIYNYRIKQTDQDGKFNYSMIRKVNDNGTSDISLAPNPASNKVNLYISDLPTARYELNIFNSAGLVVKKSIVAPGNNEIDIKSLAPGLYIVSLRNFNSGITKKIKLIKQ